MLRQEFYYDLPEELIAQEPIEPRDASRLLALGRQSGDIADRHFFDIVEYLREGDCLVLNDSRVLPARLLGKRAATGANVVMNMARGRVIYRNGEFLTLDLERIKAEVKNYALPLIFG